MSKRQKCQNCMREGIYKVEDSDGQVYAYLCDYHAEDFERFLKDDGDIRFYLYRCNNCGHLYVSRFENKKCFVCKHAEKTLVFEANTSSKCFSILYKLRSNNERKIKTTIEKYKIAIDYKLFLS